MHLNKLFISLLSTFIFIIIGTVSASAANPIKGVVTDAKSNEALIGVSINPDYALENLNGKSNTFE